MGRTADRDSSDVGADGNLTVRTAEAAPHGGRPGTHVCLAPTERRSGAGRHAGALADTASAEAVDELIAGLDAAKAERATLYGDLTLEA
jgi:hypothetical protein